MLNIYDELTMYDNKELRKIREFIDKTIDEREANEEED